jgi:predicted acyltransferase
VYLAGVLQRIAVAYLFAALLFCFLSPRALGIWAAALLVGYWAVLTFVPVPAIGPPSYEQGKNLAFYIDQHWLPGRKFEGTLLSTMPAVANCILGVFAGLVLQDAAKNEREKVRRLLAAGMVALLAGLAWSIQFPIIKLLWTSSYVLVTCGIGAILLAVFHQLTEVWQYRTWCRPFVWIGANAITIYIASALLHFQLLADRIVGGDVAGWLGPLAASVRSLAALAMVLWLAWYLYRRKIFLRL